MQCECCGKETDVLIVFHGSNMGGEQFMRMVRRMLAAFLAVFLLIGVSAPGCAVADGALKIGDGDGFLLKSLEIVDAYNDLMSGRDPN